MKLADEAIDEKVLRLFASGSSGELNPMVAIFGGLVGQEAIKSLSGKFHPLFQFFYFDSLESLPAEPIAKEDLAPIVRLCFLLPVACCPPALPFSLLWRRHTLVPSPVHVREGQSSLFNAGRKPERMQRNGR